MIYIKKLTKQDLEKETAFQYGPSIDFFHCDVLDSSRYGFNFFYIQNGSTKKQEIKTTIYFNSNKNEIRASAEFKRFLIENFNAKENDIIVFTRKETTSTSLGKLFSADFEFFNTSHCEYSFYNTLLQKTNFNCVIVDDNFSSIAEKNNEQVSDELNNFLDKYPLQLIFYGVPGTGKSYSISKRISELYKDFKNNNSCEYVYRITLHPDYSYFDFVGSILPTKNDKDITYEFNPGVFTLSLLTALKNPNKCVFLVIEEMSRANVASVFGELFQLLDRDNKGESQYRVKNSIISKYLLEKAAISIENDDIYLPPNLFIWGTVNTSDQNVFVMDNAFKRRFEFEYIGTEISEELIINCIFEFGDLNFSWYKFYQTFNYYVTSIMKLHEDKQIGPFFLNLKSGPNSNVTLVSHIKIRNKP